MNEEQAEEPLTLDAAIEQVRECIAILEAGAVRMQSAQAALAMALLMERARQ